MPRAASAKRAPERPTRALLFDRDSPMHLASRQRLNHESLHAQYNHEGNPLIGHRIARCISIASITRAAGCSTGPVKGLLPWIPQGPGNTPGDAREPAQSPAPQAGAPQPAPASTRRMEVAPDLVAQSPPAPRSAAEMASAAASAASYTQGTRYGDLVFVSGQIAL